MKKISFFAALAAVGLMSMSTTANAFSTTACMACHTVADAKVGPSFKEVVAKYGSEEALAKTFKSGFAIKDRKVLASDKQWAAKAAVMTMQFTIKIKGHEKEAAHAVFESVKKNALGDY